MVINEQAKESFRIAQWLLNFHIHINKSRELWRKAKLSEVK